MTPYYNPYKIKCAILTSTTYLGWDQDCVTGGLLNPTKALTYNCNPTIGNIRVGNESPSTNNNISIDYLTDLNASSFNAYFSNTDNLTLTIQSPIAQVGKMKVIAMSGKVVTATTLPLVKGSNNKELQGFSRLPTGVYFVSIIFGDKQLISQKCFKNR